MCPETRTKSHRDRTKRQGYRTITRGGPECYKDTTDAKAQTLGKFIYPR